MFLLLVEMHARPGAAPELSKLLTTLLELARREPDTFVYAVHRQQANPDAFVLYELYRDRSAWETHCAGAAVQSALQQFDSLLTEAPRLVFCDTVGLAGVSLPA